MIVQSAGCKYTHGKFNGRKNVVEEGAQQQCENCSANIIVYLKGGE